MKKIKLLFGIVLATLSIGCEGPEGLPGRDGLDGQDGVDGARAEVYEQTLNFTFDAANNTWNSEVVSFDDALEGDVYLGFVSLENGLFTSLPASFFDEFGEFQYVYNHDFDTVQFQIIADNDIADLGTDFTQNVLTRIAIIPADLFSESGIDGSIDILSLMDKMNVTASDIILQ